MSMSKSNTSAKAMHLFCVESIRAYNPVSMLYDTAWHTTFVNQDQFYKDFAHGGSIVGRSCSCPRSHLCSTTQDFHNFEVQWYNTKENKAFFVERGLTSALVDFHESKTNYEHKDGRIVASVPIILPDIILHEAQHPMNQVEGQEGWRRTSDPSAFDQKLQYDQSVSIAANPPVPAPVPAAPPVAVAVAVAVVAVPPTPPNTPVKKKKSRKRMSRTAPRRDAEAAQRAAAAPSQQQAPKRIKLSFDPFDVGAHDIIIREMGQAILKGVRGHIDAFTGRISNIEKLICDLTYGGKVYETAIEEIEEICTVVYLKAKDSSRISEGLDGCSTKYIIAKGDTNARNFLQEVTDYFKHVALEPAKWKGSKAFFDRIKSMVTTKCISYDSSINLRFYTALPANGVPSYLYYMNKFNSILL
jgi:hypothetical protein